MKNNQKKNEQTLQIPIDVQQRCGFADAETLAVTAAEGVCVIHKGEMTALELIRVIAALSELASDMTVHLAGACGLCNNCEDENPEASEKGGCNHNPAEWVADCSLCRDLLDENQDIRLFDRDLDLHPDLFLKRLVFQLNTAGIDHPICLGQPFAVAIDPVSGDARGVFDDREPLLQHSVEDR